MGDGIELVAVHDQQAAAIGGDVDRAAADAHHRQRQAAETTYRAVVVAGNVDDLGAGAAQRVQRLDHAVVRGAPGRAPLRQPPQVDDVADEVEPPATQRGEEFRQFPGMAMARTEVHVGEEDRAPHRRRGRGGDHAASAWARCSPR
jgi:hypothetical protein